jgi:hypothetical protein
MGDFDLDLQSAEGEMDGEGNGDRVVLGVLDGSTDPGEWVATIEAGNALVLDIDGELPELAEGFAPQVKEMGGELMHFRGFLVVTPPGTEIDTARLS